MDVMGLDLSKSGTGWARYRTGEPRPTYDSIRLGSVYNPHDEEATMRSLAFWWQEQIAFGEPDVIYIERYLAPSAQKKNGAILIEIFGAMRLLAAMRRVRFIDMSDQTWKASQLKAGRRLSRDEAKALSLLMSRDLGMKPKNDNEADALHILDYGLWQEGITPPWHKEQRLPLGAKA